MIMRMVLGLRAIRLPCGSLPTHLHVRPHKIIKESCLTAYVRIHDGWIILSHEVIRSQRALLVLCRSKPVSVEDLWGGRQRFSGAVSLLIETNCMSSSQSHHFVDGVAVRDCKI